MEPSDRPEQVAACANASRRLRLRGPLAAWAVIVALPLLGYGTARFFHNDSSGAPGAGLADIAWPRTPPPQPTEPVTGSTSVAPVDSLIAGLEARLANEPTDAKGWALLAQSYAFLGRSDQTESAIAKAVALGMDETELRRRVDGATGSNSPASGRGTPIGDGVIHGLVKLESVDPVEIEPGSRLFVTAKAIDGSTVPVAVIGERITEFPFQFELSDTNAMMPGVKLSDFEEVALSARLSQSGTAQRSEGDLESAVKLVHPGEPGRVDLVIEKR